MITKSAVPYIGVPACYYIFGCLCLVGYALQLVFVPDVRPGIAEVALGLALGAIAGLLLGPAWIARLASIASEVRTRPWLRWSTLVTGAVPVRLREAKFGLIMVVVLLGGFFVLATAMDAMWRRFPGLRWPWVGPCGQTFREFSPAPVLVYMLVTAGIVSIEGIRWYRRLPQEDGGQFPNEGESEA